MYRFIILFTAVFHLAGAKSLAQDTVRIIAGAESHGLVRPCDCPDQPLGGLARRAAIIEEQRKKHNVLLLDAGGFAAGGMYDSYSSGRVSDSLRTYAMIKAMGIIGYDAVGVGDDDIQFGGEWLKRQSESAKLPLISANYLINDTAPIAPGYRLVKKGAITFAITSVGTPDLLFEVDRNVGIEKPTASIERIWSEMVRKSDVQIILSHLGEEKSRELMASFPEADLIINGHRKIGIEPAILEGKDRAVMQFGFQGKYLSALDVIIDSDGNVQLDNVHWISVGEGAYDEYVAGNIEKALAEAPENPPETASVYDLYLMSMCSYGLSALEEILPVSNSFDIDLNIHFIGDVVGEDSLKSLHGEKEVEEEKRWLAVKELYPTFWKDFIHLRVENKIETAEIIRILELDEERIDRWVDEFGFRALATHYRRSNRLQINASPTLLINGTVVSTQIEEKRLSKQLCEQGQNLSLCDSLPECFDDHHCKKKGKIGTCGKENNAGKCVYKDPVSFSFIAVVGDTLTDDYERQTIETTQELFPGVKVSVVSYQSKEGKHLFRKHGARGLPFFLFEDRVQKAHNFEKIVSGIEKSGSWYRFKPGIMRITTFPQRKRKPGQIEIFVDPEFVHLAEVVKAVHAFDSSFSAVTISPAWYGSADSVGVNVKSLTFYDTQLAMQLLEPERYYSMLNSCLQNTVRDNLEGNAGCYTEADMSGLDSSHLKLIESRKKEIASLKLQKPVELLLNNQKLIPINSPMQLKEQLSEIYVKQPEEKGKN